MVTKAGEEEEPQWDVRNFVSKRVDFYSSFNGTDFVETVNDMLTLGGSSAGSLAMSLPGPMPVTMWQVAYSCGNFVKSLAAVRLTVSEAGDGQTAGTDDVRFYDVLEDEHLLK
ncbi:hypothetical protein AAVH_11408 [Aphelenchoides avenae]|nr:hypothetical protein AAVH_42195 [Aphelenchus avenae]KAH7721172.1 hypothetical protein AAVH_11408 [Aphelenchus avenae]